MVFKNYSKVKISFNKNKVYNSGIQSLFLRHLKGGQSHKDIDKKFIKTFSLCSKIKNKEILKFIDLYKKEQDNFEAAKIEPVEIKIKKNIEPNSDVKGYWINRKDCKLVQEEVNRLSEKGIIIMNDAFFNSPGFSIKKKNGEARLVIDYKKLNNFIYDEPITIPLMQKKLLELSENEFFGKLDFKNGFNQLKLHEDSITYTGFVIFNKVYCYKRLPFGLKNGPKVFQNELQKILNDKSKFYIYMDDILIFGKTQEEHDNNLLEALKKLYVKNIQINWEKSEFNKESIEMLGYCYNIKYLKI